MSSAEKDLTIGAVLDQIVHRAAEEVEATAAAALSDEPDGVHQHRVRVRRLRSVLAGFQDSLDTRSAQRLRVAFSQWGSELGVVRDIEVRAAVAEETMREAGIEDAEVVRRLIDSEREAYVAAHARLVELANRTRAQERNQRLREFVDALVVAEPERDAAPVLSDVLQSQTKRVLRVGRHLDESDERYHDLRKAARRAKYVAEAVAEAAPGLWTKKVEALAEAGDDLHDALGDHRDGMLLAYRARHEGALAGRAGERADVYDTIADLAQKAAEEHLADVPKALRRLEDAASDLP
ncbi:CHAD domain-containing protein [Microbacterium ureisolvens]|uniref:CHAD domain-containing protein n=1 Tax=Microbacterium ureisolvens TaxID=2781186 RepID=A0ABS7I1D6_9MICO|nr:CHAD domain-containing protein [Microbacterium ureisolvens]MBW9110597.1 CHAD domain-containing protein [Microbacterium ureisolvens]